MGGSAIGADLARGVIGDRARRPLVTSRDYAPPSWVGEDTLVLCSSYSGETEETLAAYARRGRSRRAAGRADDRRASWPRRRAPTACR